MIRTTPWAPQGRDVPLEVLPLRELRPRLRPLERIDFYGFLLGTGGSQPHEVDFERHTLRRGALFFVRPRQVMRWHPNDPPAEGLFLIFEPTLLLARARAPFVDDEARLPFDEASWPTRVFLTGPHRRAVARWFRFLQETLEETPNVSAGSSLPDRGTRPLARHLLAAFLTDLAQRHEKGGHVPAQEAPARSFRAAIERSFRNTRAVQDYATHARVSVRTLDRISRDAFGRSAKAQIDARVVLEARRLLAYSSLSIAEIAEKLGFSEPTNFGKFFQKRTGETPGAFRAANCHGR
jgi:AraC-like DNA-binding protein